MPRLTAANSLQFPTSARPYWRSDCGWYEVWCADCREVLPRIDAVDFVFTDPPYGHNNNDGDLIANREKALGEKRDSAWRGQSQNPARPIANDGPEANELVRWAFGEWRRLLRVGGCCCCCCCGGGGPDPQFARWSMWLDQEVGFKHMVVWDKGPMGMGWHYRRSYETVLVGEKPGGPCRWYDESSAVENIIRPGAHGVRKIIPSKDEHPTAKPPELAAHFIRLHTLPGHVVLDPFMGCGSTGVACARMGRRFIGVELDLEFCRDAVGRIQRELMSSGAMRAPALAEAERAVPVR